MAPAAQPLTAAGQKITDGQKISDLFELTTALQVAHGVCCDQLGETCDGGDDSDYSLPIATIQNEGDA